MIAFIRTVLLLGIFVVVLRVVITYTYTPLPVWTQNLMNPVYEDWHRTKYQLWLESRLHDHWLFEGAPWISAAHLYQSQLVVGTLLLVLYLACLLCAAMCRCVQLRLKRRDGNDDVHEKHRAVRELLKTPKDKIQGLHIRISPAIALTKDALPRKIMPVVALTWPWRGGGLWQSALQ